MLRICMIDNIVRNSHYPTKEDIIKKVTDILRGESLIDGVSYSTIEKDMFIMRVEYDAPLKYSKLNGGYHYTEEYDFWKGFLEYWNEFIDFPIVIKRIIYDN